MTIPTIIPTIVFNNPLFWLSIDSLNIIFVIDYVMRHSSTFTQDYATSRTINKKLRVIRANIARFRSLASK